MFHRQFSNYNVTVSTDRANLENVASLLPHTTGGPLSESHKEPAFILNPQVLPGYVWPQIQFDLPPPSSSVLLVTAPGAMGKSAAAKSLAATIDAPLIDVARLTVGSDSLTGLLSRVLGFTQAAKFVHSLQQGQASLVLDSLDEAQLRVGRDNFLAFIRDVFNILEEAVPKRQLIMFGRSDAMDNAHVALMELGLQPVRALITPLSHESACKLIDFHLDQIDVDGNPYTVHRTNPIPFGDWRDSAFDSLAQALGADQLGREQYWRSVEDFLGYPPVLMALARKLAVPNPLQTGGQSFTTDRATRGDLLKTIVESILDRESDKVWNQLSIALGIDVTSSIRTSIFTREEQALRLIEYASGSSLRISSPAVLNHDQKDRYDALVANFLPDHPFIRDRTLANVVFSDYVRAIVTVSPLQLLHGVTTTEILRACPTLGPFYVHFVLSLTSVKLNGNLVGMGRIDDRLADDVIRSHLMGVAGGGAFIYGHFGESAFLSLMDESPFEDAASRTGSPPRLSSLEVLDFDIVDPGILSVSAPLRHGVIVTEGCVVVDSSSSGEIGLGPSLMVRAGDIELNGRSVVVFSDSIEDQRGVVLRSVNSASHSDQLQVRTYGDTKLRIDWPNPSYQWMPYLIDRDTTGDKHIGDALRWQILISIRRILLSFRKSVSDSSSAFSEFIERDIIHGSEVVEAVFNGLVELSSIRRDGNIYHLRLERLSEYGVSWNGLNSSDVEGALGALYSDLVATSSMHEIIDRSS